MLVLKFRVRARVRAGVRLLRYETPSTKRLQYEMSGRQLYYPKVFRVQQNVNVNVNVNMRFRL